MIRHDLNDSSSDVGVCVLYVCCVFFVCGK